MNSIHQSQAQLHSEQCRRFFMRFKYSQLGVQSIVKRLKHIVRMRKRAGHAQKPSEDR